MRSKRVPDRVHVVRPPEQEAYAPRNAAPDARSIEIVRMLAKIGDKLKRSEAERYELLNELREYRKSLRELEDKAENSDKKYLLLENKIKTGGAVDSETLQRQVKFEKTLKATEDKMVKAIAGQALIDKRLTDSEDKQISIDQRLDQSLSEQTRLDRQLELTAQDKARMLRKVERLEEIVTDTQETLRAKAMVLLTDQSSGASALQAPAWGAGSPDVTVLADGSPAPWWHNALNMQTIGMASMIVAALLGGWTINQVQQPEVPQIAILENGGLARLNLNENRWEAIVQGNQVTPSSTLSEITDLEKQKLTERLPTQSEGTVQSASLVPQVESENILDYSDEKLLAALNNDPEKLAGQLNDIEPRTTQADKAITRTTAKTPQITAPMRNFDKLAFKQNADIVKAVKSERNNASLASRVTPDRALPTAVKDIEVEALGGNAEAQHDLAAIYTAGRGGVTQNFDKAAFWFREASNNGIANARYNLGVLYHQGLGRDRDLSRALYWYREAAKLDHAEAQYNLGIAHIEGIGTDYDPRLAAAFFERAANNGIMEAAYNLGLIYENGLLGDTKPEEALLWYKIAADQGSDDATMAMKQLAKNLQIDMDDVNKLVDRMQQINQSVKGKLAGPQKTSARVNQRQALTAQVQEHLMLTGSYTGPADGISGPKTEKAIRTYQERNNLPVNGRVSKELLNAMLGGTNKYNMYE